MSWICARCETENSDTLKVCEVCGGKRPKAMPHAPKPKPQPQPQPVAKPNPPVTPPPTTYYKGCIVFIFTIFLAAIIAQCFLKSNTPKNVSKATITIQLGKCAYTGPMDNHGQPDGKGEAYFIDGRIYRGFFVHGIAEDNGQAYFKCANGKEEYSGSFKNNKFDYGRATDLETGSYFEGKFMNGEPYNGILYENGGKKVGEILYGNIIE